jgi:hypothetical protein
LPAVQRSGLLMAVHAMALADLACGRSTDVGALADLQRAVIVPLAGRGPVAVAYLCGPVEPRRGRGAGARVKARPGGGDAPGACGLRLRRAAVALSALAGTPIQQGTRPQRPNAAGSPAPTPGGLHRQPC